MLIYDITVDTTVVNTNEQWIIFLIQNQKIEIKIEIKTENI